MGMKFFAFAILLFAISLVWGLSGGPDAFGYRWIDSRELFGPPFSWIEISSTGTLLSRISGSDDGSEPFDLPRPFNYYGIDYSSVNVGCNGAITLNGDYVPISTTIPSTSTPNTTIAPFMGDLYPIGHGEIYYQNFDSYCVIEWHEVREYSGTSIFTFEIVLNYAQKAIYFNYLSVPHPSSSYRVYNVGIENETGTIGLFCGGYGSGSYGLLEDSLTIRFRATPVATAPYFNDLSSEDDFQLEDPMSGWEWGAPEWVGPSSAHSGEYCFGTNIDGEYDASADWTLMSPDLDLIAATWPIVDFYQWYSSESGMDGGVCEVSTDEGISWSIITPEAGYPIVMGSGSPLSGLGAFSGASGDWEKVSFDMSDFVGAYLKFRFHFYANGSIQGAGWYIDDFGLSEAYGCIEGTCNLAYITNDSGAVIEIPSLGLSAITDSAGRFFIDSVKVGDDYSIWASASAYLPDSVMGISVGRFDTTSIFIMLSPELYFCDFADTNGGWIPSSTPGWEWGRPDPSLESPASAFSDSFCWGTNLGGNYLNDADWTLDFQIDLGPLEYPALKFWTWYKFHGEYLDRLWDGGNVKISTDSGSTFEVIEPVLSCGYGYDGVVAEHNPYMPDEPAFGGEGHGDFWHYIRFDLRPYAHNSVIICFELASDGFGTSRGWYIDDIQIADDYTAVSEQRFLVPESFSCEVYPNPFNSAVVFRPANGYPPYTLEITDIRGRMVYSESFRTSSFVVNGDVFSASGVYLYRVLSGSAEAGAGVNSHTETSGKIILVR